MDPARPRPSMVLAALLISGATLATTGCRTPESLVPVNPEERVQCESLSLLPPAGTDWRLERRGPDNLTFYRPTLDERHTVFGTIDVTSKKYENIEALFAAMSALARKRTEEQVSRNPLVNLYLDTTLPYEAIRAEYLVEDAGIPGNPETAFVTAGILVFALHPDTKRRVDLLFTQRYPDVQSPLPLVDDVERLLNSVTFKTAPSAP